MSEGEKEKKKKKTVLFIFLRNIPQCLCRRRNKKNNHHFKVLKAREFVNIQTMPSALTSSTVTSNTVWL
jgi:hypothetical protein